MGTTRRVSCTLEGLKEFQFKLADLSNKAADRVARNVNGAGLRAIRKAIVAIAPQSLKKSIGMVNGRSSSGMYEAKVGVNVGKRSKIVWRRWGPLIVLGSRERTRKRLGGRFAYIAHPTASQLSTGHVGKHPIVVTGAAQASGAARAAMKKAFDRSFKREIAKLKLNN